MHALNGLLARIAQAMQAQSSFVADAAHELRTPLTALHVQLQLAERATDDAARAQALAKLGLRLERTSHLVRQLLTLARHDAGSVPAPDAQVDLQALALTAVGEYSTLAEQRGIDLGLDADAAAAPVRGDPDALAIVLNNLIDNALRYTPAGGRVDVWTGIDAARACLRVRDSGPGVPEAERARLFDRFYRAGANDGWGCGLGLSIVSNIAERHQAEIVLAPWQAGQGLTITLRFASAQVP